MIKKEIAEIKRQFTPANCSISRICGCYVDGEKNKKADFKEAFLSLPEEDILNCSEKICPVHWGKTSLTWNFRWQLRRRVVLMSFY